MKRSTLIGYRKSRGNIIMRLPGYMMAIDSAGRIHGRDNMYIILREESDAAALAAWSSEAKSASAAERKALAERLEPRGLKIAHYGDNGDAVLMWADEFEATDIYRDYLERMKIAAKRREEMEAKTVTISLVSRGWGDFGMVAWRGDITRPTAEIVADCRALLDRDTIKDRDMTDAEIAEEVESEKAQWAAKNAKREAAAAHIEDCKRRAREIGERVEIRHYMSECHDPSEECSLDIVTEWAMPDGSISTTYQHTW